ncbi:hypothetical protein CgunFtcFv8_022852 [Champsocephalus gunnari]|uniref:Uncharacterized protein n=1 Tax=Champsocephalus gunnari TaxID=52237 RepID=A0AAN8D8S2_CHAGU|nr:hypothetical protein CgunFtcFv8_022852 [Champsocephalus gunnari]
MQAAGHVGQQLLTTTRHQPAHQPYQPVPPPVANMYGSMQAATQIPYQFMTTSSTANQYVPAAPAQPPHQPQYAPALYPAHQLPATQQPVAQHPVVMPQQSSYGPHNWSVAPSPYTQSAVPQQTVYQSLPVLPAQYAYQPAQYQQGHPLSSHQYHNPYQRICYPTQPSLTPTNPPTVPTAVWPIVSTSLSTSAFHPWSFNAAACTSPASPVLRSTTAVTVRVKCSPAT